MWSATRARTRVHDPGARPVGESPSRRPGTLARSAPGTPVQSRRPGAPCGASASARGDDDEVHPMFVALVLHAGERTLSTRQSTIHWSARCMIPLDESICVVLL